MAITEILVNGERVTMVGPVAVLPSRSQPGTFRTVYNGTCDCPAGTHGRKCWHVNAVQTLQAAVTGTEQAARAARIADFNSDAWGR